MYYRTVEEYRRHGLLLRARADLLVVEAQEQVRLAQAEHRAQEQVLLRLRRTPRRMWTRKWLTRRKQLGHYDQLLQELRDEDTPGYFNYMRMAPHMFDAILDKIGWRIKKKSTFMREPLPPGLKLALTLRYLATGDNYHSVMYSYRVSHNTISLIVREVCTAIRQEYAEEFISCPSTPEGWQPLAEQFGARWQFHNALGALDGKHIAIKKPNRGGSRFYNYKGFHSIVLLALVDADYKFTWCDVGSTGCSSDAQIWNHCELQEAVNDGTIGFPDDSPLPYDDRPMPYFFIGDDAFALRATMMKPYSRRTMDREERIFNYRLSRARRIVENAFGILAHRWRCLLSPLQQQPQTVVGIVTACICLHNLMRTRYRWLNGNIADREDVDHNIVPGAWRADRPLLDIEVPRTRGGNRDAVRAKKMRDYLKEYYNSAVGAVPWQDKMTA